MGKYKLENAYLFKGFIIKGVRKTEYRGKDAVIITLGRNQKKLYVLLAIQGIELIMIRRSNISVISPVVNLLSFLKLK
jgi:hypothetical protein